MKTSQIQSVQIINQRTTKISSAERRAIDARLATIREKLKKHKWDSAEEVRKMRLRWSS